VHALKASPSGLVEDGRNHGVERRVVLVPQIRRQDPDDAPVILPAHRKEQVESFPPEVDIDFVRNHGPRHLRIGDVEHVLVGCAGKSDAAKLAHRAARAIAASHPRGGDFPAGTVRLF
jgi:hypothetical protein